MAARRCAVGVAISHEYGLSENSVSVGSHTAATYSVRPVSEKWKSTSVGESVLFIFGPLRCYLIYLIATLFIDLMSRIIYSYLLCCMLHFGTSTLL